MNNLKPLFFLLVICMISLQLKGQNTQTQSQSSQSQSQLKSIDPAMLKTMKVDDLSDDQIAQMKAKLTADGVSMADFEKQAIAAGAQPAEVKKLIDRMNKLKVSSNLNTKNNLYQDNLDSRYQTDSLDIKKKKKKEIKKDSITVFGSEIFNNQQISFSPNLNMPTPKNYILSTNDQLIIDIYGFSEATHRLKISPDGYIRIPLVGPIFLNGLTLEQAKIRITNYLEKNGFSRLKSGGTSVQITLGEIRSIKVTMIGEITAPGTYTFPSLATVYTALYASGGPNKNGSFRDIQLIRDNKIISTVDIYDFLMKGDKSNDLVLKDQDIIRVNPYKKRVTILGEIKHPAIFEATDADYIKNMLDYCGGFSDIAYRNSLNIIRVNSQEKEILDVKTDEFNLIKPANGDTIKIGKVLNRFSNRVLIMGSVFREGQYALSEGLTVSGLIKKADGLLEDAYLPKATLFRKNEDLTPSILTVDLHNVLQGNEDILLKKEDSLFVYSKFKIREVYTVSINGEVIKPGEFPFSENMHVKDVIYMAGGLKETAGKTVEIARRKKNVDVFKKNSITTEIINYPFNTSIDTLVLQPFDVIFVKNDPRYLTQSHVIIAGEVANPGNYALESYNERLSSVIKRSGGLTANSFIMGAMIYRMKSKKDTIPGKVGIDLEKALRYPGSSWDIILVPNDSIKIPKEIQTVTIEGQVFNPSQSQFRPNKSVRYYLSGAGGLNEKALRRGIYLIYANGSIKSTSHILGFNFYPHVLSGSKIFVPEKEKKEKMSESAKVGMYISILSTLSTVGILLYQTFK
ncbi:MAG: SLBB domain-containing protein [Bacteroidetes bacterium]|nr:SLBB domain-containing protein [Bacteroidota bacterium]